jgi:hypothetical protein
MQGQAVAAYEAEIDTIVFIIDISRFSRRKILRCPWLYA